MSNTGTVVRREQIISDVEPGSPADRAGARPGDVLLSINGAPVVDLVDYEYLTANRRLTLLLENEKGESRRAVVRKDDTEPLGLSFASSLMDNMRTCRNRCLFCFIDQMVPGVRTSLHVKDDDWRMSFIMGNYVTLTNVDEKELERMIARRVSPLYISLHATDPAVRTRLMANPTAGNILPQLERLKAAGLRFNLQIVLCPGINDGSVLRQTLADVEGLLPAVQSVAIVPVGLTRFREKLYPLRCFTCEEAGLTVEEITALQNRLLSRYGTRLAFLSDEWYALADMPLPPIADYEDFPQIENGVGLLRLFEGEMLDALAEQASLPNPCSYVAAGGVTAAKYLSPLMERLSPYGAHVEVQPIMNRYFGEQITVGGLITGGDLTEQVGARLNGRPLLIPRNMLREGEDVFLDNMTLSQAQQKLGVPILPFRDGEEFIQIIFGSRNA